jgi:hypothetical protein
VFSAACGDLVGEQKMSEHRALHENQTAFARFGVVHEPFRAGDVRRQQIGRELDAFEGEIEGVGDGADERGLREAGYTDEEAVAAGEERDEKKIRDFREADDAVGDASADGFGGGAEERGGSHRRCHGFLC